MPADDRAAIPVARTPGVESPRKVLRMLLSFSEHRPTATVQELAGAVSAPTSTAYRYVALLKELGLLEEASEGRYRVGQRIQAVADAAATQNRLARLVRPSMERLAADLRETTMLVRVIAGAAVCVEQAESDRPVRLSVQPGQPLPLHSGASGKVLLASLPDSERDRLLTLGVRADPSLAAQLPRLHEELAAVRARGWAESHGEIDEGIWACATMLHVPGEARTALSVAGPAYRLSRDRRRHIRRELVQTSTTIAAEASDPGPSTAARRRPHSDQ